MGEFSYLYVITEVTEAGGGGGHVQVFNTKETDQQVLL